MSKEVCGDVSLFIYSVLPHRRRRAMADLFGVVYLLSLFHF